MYFHTPQINEEEAKKKALKLFFEGYRVTSRKFRHLSRVDISDEAMVKMFIKQNYGSTDSGVPSLSLESQRDFYRRVYSKDTIVLPASEEIVLRFIKSFSND